MTAFAATVAELYAEGRIGVEHEAWVTAGVALAAELDVDATATDLWREYRMVLDRLLEERDDGDSVESSTTQLLGRLSLAREAATA